MSGEPISVVPRTIRRHLRTGLAGVIILAGGVGGWAATTELAGAVIGSGTLVVDSYTKKVQHPTGGVVGELNVREGARVKAGDVIVRLDETVTRANLLIVVKSLDEQAARRARLEAERDDQDRLDFPEDLTARVADPDVNRLLTGEHKLFELRRTARAGKKAQLNERIGQLREQIRGLDEQIQAKDRETNFIDQELIGVRDLWRKNLVQITRLTTLERDAARLHGERGALVAAVAEARGRITETTLQIMQIDQDLRTEVGKDLAEIRAKSTELVEKRVAAEDQLKRIDIRAPQDGIVHQLALHTIGGVIGPGEQIMLIVPSQDALVVEVRILPHEIDRLSIGQPVLLRFSAFNQRTTPQLNGEVSHVSADVAVDQKSMASFYAVRIAVPESEIARLGDLKLIAGMPVEAFIQTGPRTVMSYLVKPVSDQLMRTWRER
ncbi:HlyD family type I secretion periplasmic adaptor subunit [Bradyrhizobium tropiciagri]|uniref:HlyD family type I secretion periplasmic adaptor subunit n=1 Tax=Bradyrhizobium tropiciagri TaxID=312253 RepID=UPI001BAB7587|nr:HlyD family type I secretion periplasmic adaptor subunit [Bradyrhizobium tropiciagri]MBR0874833.1 HlyD family type I secretion periplasmic adaptor subunit [Bradyrhizobium tropiciagri]